jgi:hypothetical protein
MLPVAVTLMIAARVGRVERGWVKRDLTAGSENGMSRFVPQRDLRLCEKRSSFEKILLTPEAFSFRRGILLRDTASEMGQGLGLA